MMRIRTLHCIALHYSLKVGQLKTRLILCVLRKKVLSSDLLSSAFFFAVCRRYVKKSITKCCFSNLGKQCEHLLGASHLLFNRLNRLCVCQTVVTFKCDRHQHHHHHHPNHHHRLVWFCLDKVVRCPSSYYHQARRRLLHSFACHGYTACHVMLLLIALPFISSPFIPTAPEKNRWKTKKTATAMFDDQFRIRPRRRRRRRPFKFFASQSPSLLV